MIAFRDRSVSLKRTGPVFRLTNYGRYYRWWRIGAGTRLTMFTPKGYRRLLWPRKLSRHCQILDRHRRRHAPYQQFVQHSRRQIGQPQHSSDIAVRDALGIGYVLDRRCCTAFELPPPAQSSNGTVTARSSGPEMSPGPSSTAAGSMPAAMSTLPVLTTRATTMAGWPSSTPLAPCNGSAASTAPARNSGTMRRSMHPATSMWPAIQHRAAVPAMPTR